MSLVTTTRHEGTLADMIAYLEKVQREVRKASKPKAEGVGLALDALRAWTPVAEGSALLTHRDAQPVAAGNGQAWS
jgi:hypothetical protein